MVKVQFGHFPYSILHEVSERVRKFGGIEVVITLSCDYSMVGCQFYDLLRFPYNVFYDNAAAKKFQLKTTPSSRSAYSRCTRSRCWTLTHKYAMKTMPT